MQVILYLILLLLNSVFHIGLVIENTTRVPVGDDLFTMSGFQNVSNE